MFAPSWSVRLTLPLPPSANDLLRPIVVGWKGAREPIMSFAKTTVAKDWVELAGRLVDAQFPKLTGVGEVHTLHRGPIEWWATFYVKMISKDCTNSVKQLEDVLTGRVWHDDCQVVQAHQKKRITAREERVIIEIRPGASDEETTKRIMKSKSAGGSGR